MSLWTWWRERSPRVWRKRYVALEEETRALEQAVDDYGADNIRLREHAEKCGALIDLSLAQIERCHALSQTTLNLVDPVIDTAVACLVDCRTQVERLPSTCGAQEEVEVGTRVWYCPGPLGNLMRVPEIADAAGGVLSAKVRASIESAVKQAYSAAPVPHEGA